MAPGIPRTMKAVRITEYNKPYEICEVDTPMDLDSHDILIKVAVASYCHSDYRVRQGIFGAPLPQTAGHEGSGTVVAVGSDAAERFRLGDRVMCGLPLHPCGTCGDCTGPENQKQYCMDLGLGFLGLHTNGCFAEYVKCDSRSTVKLPDEVSFVPTAPLACAGRTAWRSVLKTGLKRGESVCFIGSGGGIGHLGIQFAKALGLKVIGVDVRDEGIRLSKECGADFVIDGRKGKDGVVREVHSSNENEGVHATINLSDHRDAPAIACAVTKMHGTVVQIAMPDLIEIPFAEMIFRDIRLVGSVASGREETQTMLEMVANHGVTVNMVTFHGLDSIDNVTDLIHSGRLGGKAVIIVDPSQMGEPESSSVRL